MVATAALQGESSSCPVCGGTVTDPIHIRCGHRFCKACLYERWELSASLECPVPLCRRKISCYVPLLRGVEARSCNLTVSGRKRGHGEVCPVRRAAEERRSEVQQTERRIEMLSEGPFPPEWQEHKEKAPKTGRTPCLHRPQTTDTGTVQRPT
ncbi:hypothetical protein MATL_G00252250 [Megalops atlanticus]|uniref:RING-type domain-containing protein n=1 Tax=Megalops atlanticus TaxID=7932 RepID=A0A9D3SW22_MEGAT|nr:hypothetical protein MATL_G00252250 [Megalops atlanticus]